jgi:hypothetical protein
MDMMISLLKVADFSLHENRLKCLKRTVSDLLALLCSRADASKMRGFFAPLRMTASWDQETSWDQDMRRT